MTDDDSKDWVYVTGGDWLYQGVSAQRVSIFRSRTDLRYEMLVDDALYDGDQILEGQSPTPPGPDGWLYYVKEADSGPQQSLDEAKAWVEAQPWGAVKWDGGEPTEEQLSAAHASAPIRIFDRR
jgi:hypothetical protein